MKDLMKNLALVLCLVGCTQGGDPTGSIQIDGSSTEFPISEAMAEEFMALPENNVRITVGVSGTGGGFKKFCAGETDISNASRPIRDSEKELCEKNGIAYEEKTIAYDGLAVVVHKENDWATCLTTDELAKMWAPGAEGNIQSWKDIRDTFPDEPLNLYGPGTDSGTYDFFTETIGIHGESRGDYTASEDDNVIVAGVSRDSGGLGYFGLAYYEENQDRLKVLEVENSQGVCVAPSYDTVADGSYEPLARPLFFYVKKSSLEENPYVKKFVDFKLHPDNQHLIEEVGYIGLN